MIGTPYNKQIIEFLVKEFKTASFNIKPKSRQDVIWIVLKDFENIYPEYSRNEWLDTLSFIAGYRIQNEAALENEGRLIVGYEIKDNGILRIGCLSSVLSVFFKKVPYLVHSDRDCSILYSIIGSSRLYEELAASAYQLVIPIDELGGYFTSKNYYRETSNLIYNKVIPVLKKINELKNESIAGLSIDLIINKAQTKGSPIQSVSFNKNDILLEFRARENREAHSFSLVSLIKMMYPDDFEKILSRIEELSDVEYEEVYRITEELIDEMSRHFAYKNPEGKLLDRLKGHIKISDINYHPWEPDTSNIKFKVLQ